jgi:hypothetical protein
MPTDLPRATRLAFARSFSALFLVSMPLAGQAGDLDTMGVTRLRALDSTLTGNGVVVAQPEALNSTNSPEFEVNPAVAGEPQSFFTWISTNGAATVFPNSLGTESPHADSVGLSLFGASQGVAPGVAHDYNYEADYFYAVIVVDDLAIVANVVNQSFAFFDSLSDQPSVNSTYDSYIAGHGNVFCSAVNGLNYGVGPPGTAYNCIGVAAYGVGAVVLSGPTADNGRSKPDLVAPGQAVSFTTPYVTGAASVLLQAAARGDGGPDIFIADDRRTVKALLLNGALKPFDWTHTTNAPLDTRYGAGVLNLFYAYEQLAAGQKTYTAENNVAAGGAHPPISSGATIGSLLGWDFQSITNLPLEDTVNHYLFNVPSNSTLTATLVWERQAGMTNINNLALFLYNATNSALLACSVSAVDNVQHLYLPQLPPGTYDLEAIKYGGPSQSVTPSETYALAFDFFAISAPALSAVPAGPNTVLTWPASPTVFVLQQTSALTPPVSWSNVTAQEWITNNTVWVSVNSSGAAGFYRLAR